jgi:hypothetical protein
MITVSAVAAVVFPRTPVVAGVPRKVESVAHGMILMESPAAMPKELMSLFAAVTSSELIVTVVAVLFVVVEMSSMWPVALPLVI